MQISRYATAPPQAVYDLVAEFEKIPEAERIDHPDFQDYRRFKAYIENYNAYWAATPEEQARIDENLRRLARKMDGGMSETPL